MLDNIQLNTGKLLSILPEPTAPALFQAEILQMADSLAV